MTQFKEWLHFNAYRCFLNFSEIDETTEDILEMFNTDLKVKEISPMLDFTTEWEISGIKYHFNGKNHNNEWTVGFDKNLDYDYLKTNSNKYIGDIFTGVFESLRLLISKHDVRVLAFSTPSTHAWLIKFYNSKSFKRYLERHFKFSLIETGHLHGMNFWRYENNGNNN